MGLREYLEQTGNRTRWRWCAVIAVLAHVSALAVSGWVMARPAEYGMAGAVPGGGDPKVPRDRKEETVELEADSDDAPVEKRKPMPKPTPVIPTGVGGPSSGGALEVPSYYRNPPPEYPDSARRLHEEGIVLLRVEVDSQGRVESVSLLQSSGFPVLDDAAQGGVREWRFKPANVAGVAIATGVNIPIRFRLKDLR